MLDNVVPLSFPFFAKVENVPLHLSRQGLELIPEPGEDLSLTGDEVGNPSVRAEIADDDDGVVGQDELFKSVFVSTVDDIREDGIAIATEKALDDIGADFAISGVVECVAHIDLVF
jgi:hypothetical protein